MKYRRSWLPLRAGHITVDPGGAPPSLIHRSNLSQWLKRIDEIETPIQFPHQLQFQEDQSKSSRMRLRKWPFLAAGPLFLAISGCTLSTTRYGWPGSYAPAGVPNAQDCVPITFGQPTEFACRNGKVYTAAQLKELRKPKATGATIASAGY